MEYSTSVFNFVVQYSAKMSRVFLFIIAFVLSLSNTYAQLITIGSGTATNSTTSGSPINIWYRSLHCQMVYTKAELNAAGIPSSSVMTKFGFYIAGSPLYALPNFTVSMKHTTATNPSVYDGTGLTVVKNIPTYSPVAGGWDTLALDTPFCWNGIDNILVDVCFDPVPSYTSSGQVRIFSATNGFKYVRSDVSSQCGVTTTTTSTDKPQAIMRFENIGSPVANFSADTVCVDLPTTFTNATLASCGTPTYLWDFAGLGTSTAVNPTFIFPAAGTYPVKLVATLGVLKDSIIKDVIVKPRPSPTISTSNPNICIGDPVTITTTATGTKKWYINDTLYNSTNFTLTAINYVPLYNDTIKIEETSPNGCSAWSNIIIINRNPYPAKPVISKTSPTGVVCMGDSVTLYSSSPTGNQWYIKSGTAYVPQTGATGQTFKYPANSNFVASVEVSTPFNCKKRSEDFLVSVEPAIVPVFNANQTTGIASQTIFFSDFTPSVPPGSQYIWYFGTGDSSTLKNPSYTYINPATYTVTLRIIPPAGEGCEGTTIKNDYIVINPDTSTSIQHTAIINENTVAISPNPATDNVTITYTLNRADNVMLAITDLNGKTYLTKQENQTPGTHRINYNTSELSAGVYMVRIVSGTQSVHRKLIITK